MVLYTDIDPAVARTLPPVIDHLYDAWVAYFGPLPPNREGTDYQVTGYLMRDKALFREFGLLPLDVPYFHHGRHRGVEFWMNDQEYDYYRRHLMIHEATHCFMTTMPDGRAPVWYLEGMAELFGTHEIADDGTVVFRVMPYDRHVFAGHGRITMINEAVAAGEIKSLDDVASLRANDFLDGPPYAWAWTLCKFLDTHPRYRQRFRSLGGYMAGAQFATMLERLFHTEHSELETEWLLFVNNLEYGYDIERTAIDFRPGYSLPAAGRSDAVKIAADRGWQSSGVRVERGRDYLVQAAGRFSVAQTPKPWISEPDGISFRYVDGRPLGLLLAWIHPDAAEAGPKRHSLPPVIAIGANKRFTAEVTGTLYFRVNDSFSELADNAGMLDVWVEEVNAE
jgi:hypothetical protein